jgi:hypothetical protein
LITEWKVPDDVAENSAVPSPWIVVPAGSWEHVAELRSKLTGTLTGLVASAEPASARATAAAAASEIERCLNRVVSFLAAKRRSACVARVSRAANAKATAVARDAAPARARA